MGAHVAIQLTRHVQVHTLILFNPAIYAQAASDTPFTEAFTRLIRQPESWRDSDALDTLQKFEGNLLIVIGEEDEVIPPEVITLLDQHSPNAKQKKIFRIPGCDHNLHQCFADNPQERSQVVSTLLIWCKMENPERSTISFNELPAR